MRDYINKFYFVTHTRYGAYLLGMMCGYFVHDIKSNSKFNYNMPMVIRILYWVTTLAILAICIYYPLAFDDQAHLANALYNSIQRIVWSSTVCSIILICETDNAGHINNLLSLPVLQVISRLCYCVFVFHYDLISFKKAILKNVVNFSIVQLIFDCWGTIMVTLILSFFCSIMFEMPIPEIENYFVGFVKKIYPKLFCSRSNVVESPNNI